VMLHYYLDRDLDRAAEMYARAAELASAALADPAIAEEDCARYETALADATKNATKLAEQRAAPAAEPVGSSDAGGG